MTISGSTVRSALVRLGALAVLLGLLVGLPVLVVRLTGTIGPDLDALRAAWRTGRIDDDAIVEAGVAWNASFR